MGKLLKNKSYCSDYLSSFFNLFSSLFPSIYLFLVIHLTFSDLQTIDQRVGKKYYTTLCKFIGDVMRIFENCRIFNPENSLITKNADNLESYFIQKLSVLREKVAASGS